MRTSATPERVSSAAPIAWAGWRGSSTPRWLLTESMHVSSFKRIPAKRVPAQRIPALQVLAARILGVAILLLMTASQAPAERIKDMAQVQGVRTNQLVGYGLVVGLDGSGDQTSQA